MTRLSLPVPTESTANDVPLHLQAIVSALDPIVAKDAQGTYASRPAFGTRGSWYYATDAGVNGGLYYDTGTKWIRSSPSPWIAWTPTFSITNGSGVISSDVGGSYSTSGLRGFHYRVLPGNEVEVDAEFSLTLSGTYAFCGVLFTTPITANGQSLMNAEVQNDLARCFVATSYIGNAICLFPHSGFDAKGWQFNAGGVYVGVWHVPSTTNCYISGTYPTALT